MALVEEPGLLLLEETTPSFAARGRLSLPRGALLRFYRRFAILWVEELLFLLERR